MPEELLDVEVSFSVLEDPVSRSDFPSSLASEADELTPDRFPDSLVSSPVLTVLLPPLAFLLLPAPTTGVSETTVPGLDAGGEDDDEGSLADFSFSVPALELLLDEDEVGPT